MSTSERIKRALESAVPGERRRAANEPHRVTDERVAEINRGKWDTRWVHVVPPETSQSVQADSPDGLLGPPPTERLPTNEPPSNWRKGGLTCGAPG